MSPISNRVIKPNYEKRNKRKKFLKKIMMFSLIVILVMISLIIKTYTAEFFISNKIKSSGGTDIVITYISKEESPFDFKARGEYIYKVIYQDKNHNEKIRYVKATNFFTLEWR